MNQVALSAGRELDALVAEKVMGLRLAQDAHDFSKDWDGDVHYGKICAHCGAMTYGCDPKWHKANQPPAECVANPSLYSTSVAAASMPADVAPATLWARCSRPIRTGIHVGG